MKITDVSLTLFAWESIPRTVYGAHTAHPTGKSDLGLLRIVTDEGIEGHAFLGTSSNPASLDGPALIRFLKPVVIGQDPLDRERLNRLLWARARVATIRSIGAVDIALWDIAGKKAGLPGSRLIGTCRDLIPDHASSEVPITPADYTERATDFLRGDVAVKRGITTILKAAHLAEAFRMNFETHHGGNSLNNVANLHVIMAIRNTEFFEVLLPDGMQKYGLAQDITVDRDGFVHAPTSPGLGADIDFDLIERKKLGVLS